MPHSKKVEQAILAVQRAGQRYGQLENRAKAINDEKAQIRSDLKAAGISPAAFLEAYGYKKLAEKTDRDAHDAGVALCREALGIDLPDQYDFEELIRQNTTANDDGAGASSSGGASGGDAAGSHAAAA